MSKNVFQSVGRLVLQTCVVSAVLCCVVWQPVSAQTSGDTLIKGRDVTVDNVLKALKPANNDGSVDAQAINTRSLKISSDQPTASAKEVATARKPSKKASLLITFETNSAALTAQSKKQLDVVAAALKNAQFKEFNFEVEGHADKRGGQQLNQNLSQQRAEAVRDYLVSTHTIDSSKLLPVGKGDTKPMNVRNVAAPENRRVTFVTVSQ
jgi:OmpA-OmpF porin, OOP family